MFKSDKSFKLPKSEKYKDVMIANFLYCNKSQTGVEFKCLIQFPDFFDIMKLDEVKKQEGEEQDDLKSETSDSSTDSEEE